jgi:Fe2+ transport system protein FeoA
MTLEKAALGVSLRVAALPGMGETDKVRLAGLGLRPGVHVTKILATPLRDPVELLVGSQLLAVEARLLPHIRVEAL